MQSSLPPRTRRPAIAAIAVALVSALCVAACATTSGGPPRRAATGAASPAPAATSARVPAPAPAATPPASAPAAATAPATASVAPPPPPAAAVTAPAPASTPPAAIPATPIAAPTAAAAPGGAARDATPPPAVPSRDAVTIALVLPLDSPDYARVAQAVRDGFLAAAEAARATGRCRVIAHGDDGVLGAFEAARTLGAAVVVGPLVRDDLRVLAASGQPLPLTLALNQLDDATTLPPQVYTLALSVESDARALAQRMRDHGATSVAVIGNDTPISRRFATAFNGEWLLAGGGPIESIRFDPRPDGLTHLRTVLSKSAASAVVLALDGQEAAIARNFVLRVPVYGLSLANQPHAPSVLADLEGLQFVELPWLVTPSEGALAKLPRREMGNLLLDRLYALGLDAFAVAQAFAGGVPERLAIDGATGRLALGAGQQVVRDGVLAVFRLGQVVPADAPR